LHDQNPEAPTPAQFIKTEINGNDVHLYLRQASGVWQEEGHGVAPEDIRPD